MVKIMDVPISATYTEGNKQKRPFVFVHGGALNGTSGRSLTDFFLQMEHSVLTYDLPGHGDSPPHPNHDVSIGTLVDIHSQILEQYGIKKPIIAGHSLGGMILLKYAVQNPNDVSGLILIDTTAVDPLKVGVITREQLNAIFESARNTFRQQSKYDFSQGQFTEQDIIRTGLENTNPKSLEQLMKATFGYDVRDILVTLHTPTLILRGEKDPIMTDQMSRDMNEGIRGSIYLPPVQGLGHYWFIQLPGLIRRILEANYNYLTQRTFK